MITIKNCAKSVFLFICLFGYAAVSFSMGRGLQEKFDEDLVKPLFKLVCDANVSGMKRFLEDNKSDNELDLNVKDDNGMTALHLACKKGNLELVTLLVENGAGLEVKDSKKGQTALYWACYKPSLAIVKYLVEQGAQINVRDSLGYTPLFFVYKSFSTSEEAELVFLYLANHEARLDIASDKGRTIFHCACARGHDKLVDFFADLYFDELGHVNIRDKNGNTPLHEACEAGQIEIVKFLMEKFGANLYAKNTSGETPFDLACKNKRWIVISNLLSGGYKLISKDKNGCLKLSSEWSVGLQTTYKLYLQKLLEYYNDPKRLENEFAKNKRFGHLDKNKELSEDIRSIVSNRYYADFQGCKDFIKSVGANRYKNIKLCLLGHNDKKVSELASMNY